MTLSLPTTPAPISCRHTSVHPWDGIHGHSTPSGHYLSPLNAITALAGTLTAPAGDVVAILICADDINTFSQKIDAVSALLPLPALTQAARRAKTQITQAVARMQIPATLAEEMQAPATLVINTLQTALGNHQAQQAMRVTNLGGMSTVKTALAALKQQNQRVLQALGQEIATPATPPAPVHVFIHRAGDAIPAALAMLRDIPHPDASLSYAHLFSGELSPLFAWFRGETT
ncbi:hypothetical protein PHA77_01675 [Edwardsiella tarda]|uniref:hypothetical protein n=1 Tax=Edwardsiella tarda TaxID=636 RepID=UPI002444BC9F|nr:hypothetical protein [Edwardsiella tarda]WGE29405.1 hypothetical protein PHA77_01675 [Edwardsiella tarda]